MSEELVTVCNGKYKCEGPLVCCVAGIPKIVTNLNVTLEVCLYPEGDTTQTPVPTGLVFEPGLTNVLFTDGTYLLKGVDCEKIDGTVAPDDGTAIIVTCCQMDSKGGLSEYVAMGIDDICQKLLAIAEGSDNTELEEQIKALCDKIAAGNELTAAMITELQALCKKLAASLETDAEILEALQDQCDKLEKLLALQEKSLSILDVIAANTAAITGIETSLGQIGCTEDADGNITGSVLVCKHSDTTTDPATDTIKVWWFGLDGTVVEDYEGPYVACTNLQALANILTDILECLTDTKRVTSSSQILCDYQPDGTKVAFIRKCVDSWNKDGGVVETKNVDVDIVTGKPYTVAGVAGPCINNPPMCVESQEWTYGIDNTFTQTDVDALLCVTLSDGSVLEIVQTDQGAVSQWTPQMGEWGTNLQAAADAAGLRWFVETRYIRPLADLSGGGGFDGPPSVPVSNALYAGGMRARYLNIQICPGQPVPVSAVWKELDGPGGNVVREVEMTTAGAVLGPLKKFWICTECGKAPIWYLEDGVTLAEPGQIPNCWEPCGTLALTAAPPDRQCEFVFSEACDNVNEPDDDTNWVNLVTRRATVCAGEQIKVDYLIPDPDEPTTLISYALVGQFVDCDTGLPVPLPQQPCEDFTTEKVFSMSACDGLFVNREWDLGPRPPAFQSIATGRAIRLAFDFNAPTTVAGTWPNFGANDTNNSPDIQDAQVIDGFVKVNAPLLVRWTSSSAGYFALEVGECCGPLAVVIEGATAEDSVDPTSTYQFTPGVHQYRLWNIDDWTSTARNMEVSRDGGLTWVLDNNPPELERSTVKPVETCKLVKICKPSGDFIDAFTGEAVDKADCYPCAKMCAAKPGVWGGC